MSAADLAETWI